MVIGLVIGPVAVKGNFPRPPFSNEVKNGPQKLSTQTHFEDFNLPNKQSSVFSDYGDFTSLPDKSTLSGSLKYPELYNITAKSSKSSDLCFSPSEYDMPLFPVDTQNIIPDSNASNFKQTSNSESQSTNVSELNYDYVFPGSEDFDLSSLLSIPAPLNRATDHSSYNIGNVSMELFGPQPNLLDFMDHISSMESDIPDDIHYWHGLQKDSDVKESQTNVDPFMSTLYGLPSSEEHSPQSSVDVSMKYGSSPTATDNTQQSEEPSPVDDIPSVEDMSTPPLHTLAASDNNLHDLFEKTFDISDLAGPPQKHQEKSPSMKPQVVPSLFPQKGNSPLPPHVESVISHGVRPKREERDKDTCAVKSKPTLLFGKHEGDIIHKLLPKNSSHSKPLTRDKLITIPVEEFNQLLEQAELTEIEVAFMKEWRRRGKNKAAAQVARKRKREEVSELDEEVRSMRQQKMELHKKHDLLKSHVKSLKGRSLAAEDELFRKESLKSREPVSRDTHLVHITDGKLFFIPRVGSKILTVQP